MKHIPKRLAFTGAAIALTLLIGTVGFIVIDNYPPFDAFYMTVTTISTVGYAELHPLSFAGRVFNSFLIFFGVATIFFGIGAVTQTVIELELNQFFGKRRIKNMIDKLHDHYIVCGFGRVGRAVAEEFRHEGAAFTVLDFSPEAKAAAAEASLLFVEGNGTDDDDLRSAGLERARGLIAASDDDADNLSIALSARAVKPDLFIVARASNEEAAKKLRLAGADRIVQPYQAAGRVMANLILRPQVTDFVDVVTTASGNDLRFEEIEVTSACGQGGRSIRDLDVRKESGALIVALRKRDGTFDTTPTPEAVLDVGDVLIAAGTDDELRALERLFASRETVAG